MSHESSGAPLRRTPLFDLERELGGKMVDFGGWELPVQFSGILDEHKAVRERAGLFDVSHMGEITVRGPQALELIQTLTSNDASKLENGRCQYSGLLYPNAGFVDDILIYRNALDDYLIVVNASNAEKDFDWMIENAAGFDAEVRNVSAEYAQIALQGPRSQEILTPLTNCDLTAMKYYRFAHGTVDGVKAIVSRTGYTGEDGFEIYVAPGHAIPVFRKLLDAGAAHGIAACGLGARDTLRLESKMALYGNDIDGTTTPYEADLGWIVKLDKGSFTGRDVLATQKENGTTRKLVGFEMTGRGIGRHGYLVVEGGREIGIVTSGTHSPTLKKAIGLAYLPVGRTEPGTVIQILIRDKETEARVVPTPFYKRAK